MAVKGCVNNCMQSECKMFWITPTFSSNAYLDMQARQGFSATCIAMKECIVKIKQYIINIRTRSVYFAA